MKLLIIIISSILILINIKFIYCLENSKNSYIYDYNIPLDILNKTNNNYNNEVKKNANSTTTNVNNSCNNILNKNINYKNKENIFYAQSNDLNFYKNNFIYWSKIDTLIINPNNKYLKEVVCTSHQNNVRTVLLIGQQELLDYSRSNFTKLVTLIEANGSDGMVVNIASNVNITYMNEIKKLYKLLKTKNKNYYFSIALPLTWNMDTNCSEMLVNCDYLILQSFNSNNYTGVKDYIDGNSIPGDYFRNLLYKNWLEKYIFIKDKIIIGLSLIGTQKCCSPGGGRNNVFNLNYCEKVANSKQTEISYFDIYNYIIGNGIGYFLSGELWNFKTHTPFLNYINNNEKDKLYQIQYENTKSLFYKISNTGIGGISFWKIETFSNLPNYHLNSILTLLDKNITGITFKKDINIF
ncbi:hypothetical protein DICPUDRAFT_98003 [Dictyostelium purpureum]|uniref:GH18 domain-containing protein n=1 Tax=Dictyostelium purpureum TaxID=5786 RepID=F0ZLT0_DICPU|nr:uncharacterized protein DICPUDRAFT_98003 [Dictyostelium purpureum]EGC35110.1 hypothetical protein DICPUDRAFT_98003 [Dictyostelium purpureum]|eukprot:XP_003288362.1 hypothetical protein DICPUDRAFT_98003 [Dictyostelium purpureum]